MTARGLFVALEGIDGVGKTEQSMLVAAELSRRGYNARAFHDSRHGTWGRAARDVARGHPVVGVGQVDEAVEPQFRLIAFCRDRAAMARDSIRPHVEAGGIAICDRWEHSTWAYWRAWGLEPRKIAMWTRKFPPAISPDLVLWLQLPPAVALARIDLDRVAGLRPALREQYDTPEFLERVESCYSTPGPLQEHLREMVPVEAAHERYEVTEEIVQRVIDALAPPEPAA